MDLASLHRGSCRFARLRNIAKPSPKGNSVLVFPSLRTAILIPRCASQRMKPIGDFRLESWRERQHRLANEKAARSMPRGLCKIGSLDRSVVVARPARIILPVASPAAAVVGGLVAVSQRAHIFETAHVIVIAEPAQVQRGGRRKLRGAG